MVLFFCQSACHISTHKVQLERWHGNKETPVCRRLSRHCTWYAWYSWVFVNLGILRLDYSTGVNLAKVGSIEITLPNNWPSHNLEDMLHVGLPQAHLCHPQKLAAAIFPDLPAYTGWCFAIFNCFRHKWRPLCFQEACIGELRRTNSWRLCFLIYLFLSIYDRYWGIDDLFIVRLLPIDGEQLKEPLTPPCHAASIAILRCLLLSTITVWDSEYPSTHL